MTLKPGCSKLFLVNLSLIDKHFYVLPPRCQRVWMPFPGLLQLTQPRPELNASSSHGNYKEEETKNWPSQLVIGISNIYSSSFCPDSETSSSKWTMEPPGNSGLSVTSLGCFGAGQCGCSVILPSERFLRKWRQTTSPKGHNSCTGHKGSDFACLVPQMGKEIQEVGNWPLSMERVRGTTTREQSQVPSPPTTGRRYSRNFLLAGVNSNKPLANSRSNKAE